jgi:3-isopropylmalate/(R)-2-methylmalate dehydratase small subunit
MQPFTIHRGRLALLDWTDVNTDLIIPARYLKRIERHGFGPALFADKRYLPGAAPDVDNPQQHGPENADFPLNNPALRGATVLVVGRNFGCGSSREHAVWALMQDGYRALIAPGKGEGFADIFETNAFHNGLLVIELNPDDWQAIAQAAREGSGAAALTINLGEQTLTLHGLTNQPPGQRELGFAFEIPESHRQRLLQGRDAIADTLLQEPAIRQYEEHAPTWLVPQGQPA